MKEKTRDKIQHDEAFQFEDEELRSTLEEYMREENKNGTNFWNFSTITGLSMVFVATSIMVQIFLTNTFDFSPGPDLSGLLNVLPVIGGGLIALVGLGAIASEKKKKKNKKRNTDKKRYNTGKDPLDAFLYPEGKESEEKEEKTEEKDSGTGYESNFGKKKYYSSGVDSYAMSRKKKLFKSRTDKKITGVCGGLASYFGISSTMVRLIFAITTILGYGSMALIYIALAIALPKEPVDLLDDF